MDSSQMDNNPMDSNSTKRTIGFSGVAWQEVANRWLEGGLRYIEGQSGLTLRDFRFLENLQFVPTAPPPPWTGKADGVIICFGIMDDERVEQVVHWLERGGAPVVSLVGEWSHPRVPIVSTDFDAVIRLAADFLVESGHRHFALVDDSVNPDGTAHCRRVFAERLARCKLVPLVASLTFRPDGTVEDIARIDEQIDVIRLLNEAPKPLAIYAINDNHARMVCWICQEMGLKVPDEVAILGTGNLTISRSHAPTLSSIRTPADVVGYEAMKLVHLMMDGMPPPRRRRLFPPTGIVERESTRAPREEGDEVRRAIDFIREHAHEGINVHDLARGLSISRRTLERQFTERVGRSPGQEIQRTRLEKAQKLLAETDLSIAQVAAMSGFSESPRLTEFFRKQTGFSPSEYRRIERKKQRRG